MSKPIQAINRYKADLRELQFLLFEQFKLERAARQGARSRRGARTRCRVVARRSATAGCARSSARSTPSATPRAASVEDGRVITPTGFKEAWKSLYEAGWKPIARRRRVRRRGRAALAAGARRGDDQRRRTRRSRCTRASRSARPRSSSRSARPSRRQLYCSRMFGGTVGRHDVPHRAAGRQRRRRSAKTTATTNADGSYTIRGHQDLHLAAATTTSPRTSSTSCSRASTARPPGTKGLTLFIVPKIRADAGRHARRAERRARVGEHRAQDGHQRLGHVRAQLRRRRANASAGPSAATRSSTRACRRCSR